MNYKFELLERVNPVEWNRRVEFLSEGTLFQTIYKAEICRQTLKQKPFFLMVKRNDKVVAQALILTGFISPKAILGKPFLKATLPLATNLFNVYNLYYGPLIFDKSNYENILNKILYFMNEEFRKRNYILGNIILPFHDVDKNFQSYQSFFKSNGFFTKPLGTILVDLRQDINKLWSEVDERTQRYIKKMEKEGIMVFEAKTEEDIRKYHNMRLEAARRNKVRAPLLNNTMIGWKLLSSLGKSTVFLCEHNGRLVSGILISGINGIIFESGSATSDYGLHNKIRGGHLLKWHIIKWGHENNFRLYDLAGVNPDSESRSPKEEGIYQFKSKWGGRVVKFNTYTRIYSPYKVNVAKTVKRVLSYR